MNINLHAKNIELTEPIKDYVEKKFEKLQKHENVLSNIDITLHVDHNKSEDSRQTVDLKADVSGHSFHTTESSRDLYATVDLIYAKLEKHVRRHKEKLRDTTRDQHKRDLTLDS